MGVHVVLRAFFSAKRPRVDHTVPASFRPVPATLSALVEVHNVLVLFRLYMLHNNLLVHWPDRDDRQLADRATILVAQFRLTILSCFVGFVVAVEWFGISEIIAPRIV